MILFSKPCFIFLYVAQFLAFYFFVYHHSSSFTFNVHFSMLARVGRFPPYRPFHRILSCVHSALSPPGHRSSRLTHSPHVGALRCKRGPRPGDVQASPTQLFPIPDWEFLEQILRRMPFLHNSVENLANI